MPTRAPRYIPNEIQSLREDIEGLEMMLGILQTIKSGDDAGKYLMRADLEALLEKGREQLKDLEKRTLITNYIPLVME